jgi:hypothetical protein
VQSKTSAMSRPPRRPSQRLSARERMAAERAARQRAARRRRVLIALGSVTAIAAIAATLVTVSLTRTPAHLTASESAAPVAVVKQVTTVPSSLLTQVNPGRVATPLHPVAASGPPLSAGGKPVIEFVSEESCPFCAAERWPLTVALSHFGNWSQLGVTKSAATDIFPNTATLSFRAAQYHSSQLSLHTTELTDNAGHTLQSPTTLDRQLIGQYDVPPYVNSADQSGAVPFLDIGNRYILAGAQFDPQVLAGLSATQIAAQLRDPSSPVAQAIDGSANVIIAAINHVLHDQGGQG